MVEVDPDREDSAIDGKPSGATVQNDHFSRCLRRSLAVAVTVVLAGVGRPALAADDVLDHFEKAVRPVLVEHCQECHGAEKQWADLRLDSRKAVLTGGESGPAVVPGKPEASELLRRVSAEDDIERMPPADAGRRLNAKELAALTRWIRAGAPWPDVPDPANVDRERTRREHWAFQPVQRPEPPTVRNEDRVRTPVDRFVLRKLEAADLSPSAEADRRTLIRRATYDLTGLPPTPDEVAAFVADESPDAYARLIDRLLDSPRYGEQWGRHWLDVARYSDTKGYVYAREEKRFVHAARYRDWVVRAFNDDLPYDRFVRLQLAADRLVEEDSPDLFAMGFLTLGRRFLGVKPDIVDDRIDVVTRGLMGLTVGCARCHDHKYDPIPTTDYYALYGVFENGVERTVPVEGGHAADDFLAELEKRQRKLAEAITTRSAEASARVRERLADYLFAQRELDKYPVDGFDQILSKDDLIPVIVRRWETYLLSARDRNDPVFVPWFAFAELPEEGFASRAEAVVKALKEMPEDVVNPLIAAAFTEPPATPREVAARYARVFAEVDASDAADPASEAIRHVLHGPGSPCVIPAEPIVNTESLYDSGTVKELWKLQNEVDQWLLGNPAAAPHAVILAERDFTKRPRVFRRGDPARKGDAVPLRFLDVLGGERFEHGSGRLELARAIADEDNPLTARVWVNRVWAHHFGTGLVNTPSDFGLRAGPPSHPELLDWLAAEFVASGWSTKQLHRTLMLSATYRQRSAGPADEVERKRLRQLDPENRLLSRMNARRLAYEELRDTLLAVAGELDPTIGGPPVEPFQGDASPQRRSIYGRIDRQFVPSVLRVFDFANPDLHTPERSETTVPQQALFALNHPFVAARARALAERSASGGSTSREARVARLYEFAFQREPRDEERAAATAFVEAATREAEATREPPPTVAAWSYGYGELDADAGRLKTFERLPYFDGTAWQGGPKWPDATLGWVRLTAEGGHTGNDLQHAAIRRWTAPADGRVSVTSTAIHDVEAGDGIRCHVVSNRHGVLASATLHDSKESLAVESVEVQAGDTLDFVVDFNANLNSDQFLWAPEIRRLDEPDDANATASVWNAREDFAGTPTTLLGPWEQLAQVLLMSNELYFVD